MTQSGENQVAAICQPIQLKPVGVVRNQSQEPSWGPAFKTLDWQEKVARMKAQSQAISELVIDSELHGILDGIDDFSHLMVLFWAHLVPDERRSINCCKSNGYFVVTGVVSFYGEESK
jgi:tRNA (Thr-GGU) A37 N-methylase